MNRFQAAPISRTALVDSAEYPYPIIADWDSQAVSRTALVDSSAAAVRDFPLSSLPPLPLHWPELGPEKRGASVSRHPIISVRTSTEMTLHWP